MDKALEFLNGNYNMILNDLQKKMEEAAEALEFEEAARYRDLFNSVKQVSQKQKITDSDGEDKDIIALDKDGSDAVVQVFFVRGGKLIGREHFYMTHVEDSDKAQILLDFVKQFYAGTPFVPRELILQKEIDDIPVLEEWLTGTQGREGIYPRAAEGTEGKAGELRKKCKLVLEKDGSELRATRRVRSVRCGRSHSCWIYRCSTGWRRSIFPTSAALKMSARWSFMKRASPSAAITENSKSKR